MSAAGPTSPPQTGGGIGGFLTRRVFGMPLWLVGGIVIIGGVALALYIRGRGQTPSGQALGQSGSALAPDPNIDPNTGVPYSVEDAINPNTGLPAYFDLFPPAQQPNPPLAPPPGPPGPPVNLPPPSTSGPPPGASRPPPVHQPPPGLYKPPPGQHQVGHFPPPGPSGRRVPGGPQEHRPGPPGEESPPPSHGSRPAPPPYSYGGTQSTAYWPIPWDVLDLRGGVFPSAPETGYGGSIGGSGEAA